MNAIKHNKLVRDRIPEIIEASSSTCVTESLSDEDYLRMLDAKLGEELAEYHADQNIEELADLLEVIYAAAIARGYTLEQLEQVRAEKAAERGGFSRKILLKEVIKPEKENKSEFDLFLEEQLRDPNFRREHEALEEECACKAAKLRAEIDNEEQ